MTKNDNRSDFSAVEDEASPVPMMGMALPAELPTTETDQSEDDKETQKQAAPYWHPAWESVGKIFTDKIKSYGDLQNALVHKDKPADEFKTDLLVAAVVSQELTNIMEDVKRAVESVEQSKPAKQSKRG